MRIYRSHVIDDGWTEQEVRGFEEEPVVTRADHDDSSESGGGRAPGLHDGPQAGTRRRSQHDAVFRKKMSREELERELRNSADIATGRR